ncbi:MAG: hypothetical protein Q7T61_19005 [Caulobacter sp.]|nr:hypothetical protein [Caulobacter sp.]
MNNCLKAGLLQLAGMMATAGIATFAVSSPAAALDRTQALARIDRLAEYTAATAWCKRSGYTYLNRNTDAFDAALVAEAAPAGLTRFDALEAYRQSIGKRKAAIDSESAKWLKGVSDDQSIGPAVTAWTTALEETCAQAAVDPVGGLLIRPLPPEERAKARIAMADEILSLVGEASWQAPKIRAKADLMYVVGACIIRLPSALSYHSEATKGPEPLDEIEKKRRAYFEKNFENGALAALELNLSEAECRAAVAEKAAAAK